MGSGLCAAGPQVVPSITEVNCDSLVCRAKSRQFPLEGRSTTAASSRGVEVTDLAGRGGECLIFLEQSRNVPYPDTLRDLTCEAIGAKSHGHPSVRVWAETAEGVRVGNVAEWPAKSCRAPAWYSARSLGFQLRGQSLNKLRLCIELCDHKLILASNKVPLQGLLMHKVVTLELEPRITCSPKPTLSFQILDSQAVMVKRTVFFVRHGESLWNKAQARMRLDEMARTTDHPLSVEGRAQAEALRRRLEQAKAEANPAATAMLRPDAVFVSPLTRAFETAVIALGPLLTGADGIGEMVLMANARERQTLGGMDCRSTRVGAEIIQKCLDELRLLYRGEDQTITDTFTKLRFDTFEVQDKWWCEASSESPAQLQARLQEFMLQLIYSPHRTVVVVGHSLFFRSVFRQYLSSEFRTKRPQLAHCISNLKMMNCGVTRLELEPANGLDGPIVNAELILGTRLEGEPKGFMACCSEDEHDRIHAWDQQEDALINQAMACEDEFMPDEVEVNQDEARESPTFHAVPIS